MDIKGDPGPHGFMHRHFTNHSLGLYNKRGKLVLWIGGRWLPMNGPALWLAIILCFLSAFIGQLLN